MPVLDWIGKQAVVNHHKEVPYRLLHCDKKQSFGDPDDGNLIVKGDNLEALKALLPYYRGQVKCIYIDPPYNSGHEDWQYNDNVNSPEINAWLGKTVGNDAEDLCRHDKWLCMMYPRLRLLKEFLRDDGVFLCQIDEREYPSLRRLCDEVFGEQNYETTFNVKVRHEDRILRGDVGYQLVMEYVVIYRVSDNFQRPRRAKADKSGEEYVYSIDLLKNSIRTEHIGGYAIEVYEPDGYKISRQSRGQFKKYQIRGSLITQSGSASEYYEKHLRQFRDRDGNGALYKVIGMGVRGDGIGHRFIMQPEKVGRRNGFYFQGRPLSERSPTNPYPNFYDEVEAFNRTGEEGGVVFRGGKKPERWIQFLLSLFSSQGDLVMDSFGGSGTTAAVAHKMQRRWLTVEMGDHAEQLVAQRLTRVVQGEDLKGISNMLSWKGGGGFRFCTLGTPLFNEFGDISHEVNFPDLAAHIFFAETGVPLPKRVDGNSAYIGRHQDKALYLLFSAASQGFAREVEGNVLTPNKLQDLPPPGDGFEGARVVYAEGCTVTEARLQEENIIFRQTPYSVEGL